jgi:hypothetical protein
MNISNNVTAIEVDVTYPLGPNLPIIKLTELKKILKVMELLGLREIFLADTASTRLASQADNRPAVLVSMYVTEDHATNAYAIAYLEALPQGPGQCWVYLIFYEDQWQKIAQDFADCIYEAASKRSLKLPGCKVIYSRDRDEQE